VILNSSAIASEISAIEKILGLDHEEPDSIYRVADAYIKSGDYQKAVTSYKN